MFLVSYIIPHTRKTRGWGTGSTARRAQWRRSWPLAWSRTWARRTTSFSVCCPRTSDGQMLAPVCYKWIIRLFFKLHQGREPNGKTLCSPLSTEHLRHCVLSGETQRRTFPWYQIEEMEIFNIIFSLVEIESTIY